MLGTVSIVEDTPLDLEILAHLLVHSMRRVQGQCS